MARLAALIPSKSCENASLPLLKQPRIAPRARLGTFRDSESIIMLDDLANAWARSQETFWPQTLLFLSLTLRGLGLALLIGIPAGIALTRLPRLAGPVVAFLAVVQSVPSRVLLGLLVAVLGLGQQAVLFAS